MKILHQRLLALDVLRGFTIAGMILVNNPGSWSSVYAPLRHASWNGLTPTDLVFPFFMFIMGISTFISLNKFEFKFSVKTLLKISRRTLVIFAIGLGLAWLSLFWRTMNTLSGEDVSIGSRLAQAAWNFDNIRILGVLQRLALSYGFAAIIAICVRHKYIPYLAASLLAIYTFILYIGNGFEYGESNLLSIVDRAVLGLNHVYKDNGIEPEGLLSTIPSVAHVLIGFCCGKIITDTINIREKLLRLFITGTVLTFAGLLLSYGCPINKKIWSPTFVMTTCGLASSLLALLVWIIDIKEKRRPFGFFVAFGVNPLFMYVVAAIFSTALGNIHISGKSLHGLIYNDILQPCLGDYPSSLAFAILFVVTTWLAGYILYRRKIYIKI